MIKNFGEIQKFLPDANSEILLNYMNYILTV